MVGSQMGCNLVGGSCSGDTVFDTDDWYSISQNNGTLYVTINVTDDTFPPPVPNLTEQAAINWFKCMTVEYGGSAMADAIKKMTTTPISSPDSGEPQNSASTNSGIEGFGTAVKNVFDAEVACVQSNPLAPFDFMVSSMLMDGVIQRAFASWWDPISWWQ